ncbi:hypothetical protein [Ferrimonas aestuarii]|uniref:Uncharacterized protein n=1 Tax=Ferrimonas aestuarii TaxID=2569539 RepID=A0A4U1BKV8_9GAMM|nr:hypothetical protein [Ferrimonas aestuarii]TKB53291.1 hypothetical protein FCL42_14560 [Ferrimonas aestuarii]
MILTTFICQFLVVYLLGVQSLMVRDGNCIGAAMGSIAIGVTQYLVIGIISHIGVDGLFSLTGAAFLLAGPIAIVCSIKSHPKLAEWLKGKGRWMLRF